MRAYPLIVSLLALVCASPSAAAQVAAETKQAPAAVAPEARKQISARFRLALNDLHKAGSFPGATAALILPDGQEVATCVGFADKDAELRMTPMHRMLSGSVGKIYVTAAAHKLAAEEKLDFDAPLRFHFAQEEWFARVPNANDLTLRMLLRHQSGIPRYVFKPEFWETLLAEPDKQWKPADLLAYVLDDEPLFEAGTSWAYSDTNFILVGIVIEKIADKPFYDYVQSEFLTPLGLADTIPSNRRDLTGMAQGHVVASKQFGVGDRTLDEKGIFTFNPQFEWCGGGWANTALDLARFARVLYSGNAMESEYLESMLETVPAPMLGPGAEYGLGVMARPAGDDRMIGHDGFMPGYLTSVAYFPGSQVTVAIQVNTDDARSVGKPLGKFLMEIGELVKAELD